MANVLTDSSSVGCGHGAAIKLTTNSKLKVNGSAVVIQVGPQIKATDCGNGTGGGNKQCSTASPVGGTASKLKVGGFPVYLDTVSGTTDGNPPGKLTPTANQSKLTAL
jgi:hypothetical protein